jgi:hypothetical protein
MSRIALLPKRDWQLTAEQRAKQLTEILRTPVGTMELRPVQGAALYEAYRCGGLFASIRVGGGKTILSGLAFEVLAAKRPLLIVPGSLKKITKPALQALRQHWKIPHGIEVISYEKLSREKYIDYLEKFRPDVIVCDEAHKLKNKTSAACAARIMRYGLQHPEVKFVMLSGTISRNSIMDYGHYLDLALKDKSPLPRDESTRELWASILDVGVDAWERGDMRMLWPHLGKCQTLEQARTAYRDRLVSTPGVIVSNEAFKDSALSIFPTRIVVPTEGEVQQKWEDLREAWLNWDGYPLGDSKAQVWETAQCYSLGFYRYHDPWPPKEWMAARKAWCGYVREVIEASDDFYDTEAQVKSACESGKLQSIEYELWKKIEPTFTITRKTKWFSDHALKAVQFRASRIAEQITHSPLIWVPFPEFARRLSDLSRWDFYHNDGICQKTGVFIEDAPTNAPAIVSVGSNFTGRNLQHKFWYNLSLGWPGHGQITEQWLGRTHRDGQPKPKVIVEYMISCKEQIEVLEKAVRDANFAYSTQGQPQKLLDAELIYPSWPRDSIEYM